MKVTILIEGARGEGKTTLAGDLRNTLINSIRQLDLKGEFLCESVDPQIGTGSEFRVEEFRLLAGAETRPQHTIKDATNCGLQERVAARKALGLD